MKETPSTTFTCIEETEIPALQEHCHILAKTARALASEPFTLKLQELVNSIMNHLSGGGVGRIPDNEKEKLRDRWQTESYRSKKRSVSVQGDSKAELVE